MANVANQDHDLPNKMPGKQKSTEESGYATNGEHGAHTSSPADGKPTQFAIPQHDKVPSAGPEAL